ncbi:uncharacterized protein LOC119684117 [Teleopsis dalmanni]|uniref:uncharacterized protein LOC119684117 n=1 Tax=Teleopsis dalmanni TaxID=139649 RepID=UPI0018CE719D|nr:uncharacterized protein LOC119684117 [Teleopsis dalmanni]
MGKSIHSMTTRQKIRQESGPPILEAVINNDEVKNGTARKRKGQKKQKPQRKTDSKAAEEIVYPNINKTILNNIKALNLETKRRAEEQVATENQEKHFGYNFNLHEPLSSNVNGPKINGEKTKRKLYTPEWN